MRGKRKLGQMDKTAQAKSHSQILDVLFACGVCLIILCHAGCLFLAVLSIWLGDISLAFLVIRSGLLLVFADIILRRTEDTYDNEVQFEYGGIWVTYHMRRKKFVGWKEFKEIAIVYENSGKLLLYPAKEKICCVKSAGRKDCNGRWNYNNVLTCYNYVVLPYSAEIMDSLKKYCPLEIVDLRRTPEYSELNWKWMNDGEQERIEFLMDYSFQKSSEPMKSVFLIYEYMSYVQGAGHVSYFEAFSEKVDNLLQSLRTQMPEEFYNNCFEAYRLYQQSSQIYDLEKQDQYIRDHTKEMEEWLINCNKKK